MVLPLLKPTGSNLIPALLSFIKKSDAADSVALDRWRTQILEGILRGVFVLWLFALAGGISNVLNTYRNEGYHYENPLQVAASVISLYLGTTIILAYITFNRKLKFAWRAGLFLFILYALGAIGMALSSFSGDGRIFFFALIILSAVFFDLRYSLTAFIFTFLTLVLIGWLQLSGILVVPAEIQINSMDQGAWISGGTVLLLLSIAVLISITYLLRALGRSLTAARESLNHEQRLTRTLRALSNINQLIVREQDPTRLLQLACEELVSSHGYSFVWISLIEADGVTLKLAASAGEALDPDQFTVRLDREGVGPICAARAIHSGATYHVDPFDGGDDLCPTCPLLSRYPRRTTVALPLAREDHDLGVLVIDQSVPTSSFDSEEIALLEELANDLAYTLENLRADKLRHALAESASALLSAHNADSLWTIVVSAVRQILRADRVAIYLHDSETDRLSCPSSFGLSAEYVAEINRRFHDVPGSRVLSSPELLVVSDIQTAPSVELLREWMQREGFRSYTVFPFVTARGLAGAFVAYRDTAGPFSESDLTFGETLVRMIGMAWESVRLQAETHAKAVELGQLYSAAQDMAASLLDPPALLQKLARHIADAIGATSGFVFDIHSPDGFFTDLAEYWTDEAHSAERKPDLGRRFPMENYPTVMQAITSGHPLILHRDDTAMSEVERQQFVEYDIQSMLFIPIMTRGRLLGDLELWESRYRREFTPAEIQLAQAVAGHTAAILESAQLFAQTRQRETELATLLNVARTVSSSLDVRDVLKDAATSMARILRADYCTLSEYDPQTNAIETIALYTPNGKVDESTDKGILYPLEKYTTLAKVIESGEPALIRASDPQADPMEVAFLCDDHLASCLMLPLRVGRKPLGLVELYTSDPAREFTEADVNLARALADQIAVAIENASLYNKVEQGEAYFRALIENSAEGVVILDTEGKMRYVAPSEERLTGYSVEEVLGDSAFRHIHPEDLPKVLEALQEGIQSPGVVKIVQYRLQRKDGEWRYFEATGHSMLSDPHIAGMVINYRDITERKLAEQAVEQHAVDLAQAYDNTLAGWARALELRDEITEGHTRRVTELTLRLARRMGLSGDELIQIHRGAILHDIGKMGIPDSILLKNGSLSPSELTIMRRHPQFAHDMLSPISFLHAALDIPFCHHEHWDGSGYPRGLKGEQIPLAARIFSVADVWDALTSDRPYRLAWTKAKARQHIIDQAGKVFDPQVVEIFLAMGEF